MNLRLIQDLLRLIAKQMLTLLLQIFLLGCLHILHSMITGV